jgi:hypothetical protein
VTAEELIKRAAACEHCGKAHKYRRISANQSSWAAPGDGHNYRPVLDVGVVARLRYLATGQYADPWKPEERKGIRRAAGMF